jgi:hypothetical protein
MKRRIAFLIAKQVLRRAPAERCVSGKVEREPGRHRERLDGVRRRVLDLLVQLMICCSASCCCCALSRPESSIFCAAARSAFSARITSARVAGQFGSG